LLGDVVEHPSVSFFPDHLANENDEGIETLMLVFVHPLVACPYAGLCAPSYSSEATNRQEMPDQWERGVKA
jgi:hypothetical protein